MNENHVSSTPGTTEQVCARAMSSQPVITLQLGRPKGKKGCAVREVEKTTMNINESEYFSRKLT